MYVLCKIENRKHLSIKLTIMSHHYGRLSQLLYLRRNILVKSPKFHCEKRIDYTGIVVKTFGRLTFGR